MKLLAAFFKEGKPESVITELSGDSDVPAEVESIIKDYNLSKEDLEGAFLIDSPYRIPDIYLECFCLHKGRLIFDQSTIIEQNFVFWIPERKRLLKKLDIDFMKALEDGNQNKVQEIKIQKEFLRDLPNFVIRKLGEQILDPEEEKRAYQERNEHGDGTGIVDSFDVLTVSKQVYYRQIFNTKFTKDQALLFTPFYNILKIEIEDGGEGYSSPPEIEFKCDHEMAFPPKYNCILEQGKLKYVEIITAGCGYLSEPKITVSEPENGKTAIVSAKIFNQAEIEYPKLSL
tara:strand:+ start:848 stop:1708 length:861 start_codon:yes stop_codon:yes gene_type:complete